MTSKFTAQPSNSNSLMNNNNGKKPSNNNMSGSNLLSPGNPYSNSNNTHTNTNTHTKNSFLPEAEKTKFQSEDSEGSDISYQSSIESEEDINIGRIEFFKEEMSRFFINYPELINHDIIDHDQYDDEQYGEYLQTRINGKKDDNKMNKFDMRQDEFMMKKKNDTLNKNWSIIADQILNQAKQSSSFLEDLSRRIALYRSKVEQQDLIDLLLKEQKNIMKEIDLEINQKKKQIKGNKNTENIEGVENMYFSWRKKKQMENRLNLVKDNHIENRKNTEDQYQHKSFINKNTQKTNKNNKHRSLHKLVNQNSNNSLNKSRNQKISSKQTKDGQNFFITQGYDLKDTILVNYNQNSLKKSLQKPRQKSFVQRKSNILTKTASPSKKGKNNSKFFQNNSFNKQGQNNMDSFSGIDKQNKLNQGGHAQTQTFWKHLVNFEPKTEAGRQLCELIRKTNNPNDQLGIKKTIMTFLSRSKDMVQNEIVLKSTISQKIQKLYNDDSKELLMFYPTRMTNLTINNSGNSSQVSAGKQNSQVNSGSMSNGAKDQVNDKGNSNKYANFNKQTFGIDEHHKLFEQGEKFMKVLEDIVQGPLMKYWMSIQESKL